MPARHLGGLVVVALCVAGMALAGHAQMLVYSAVFLGWVGLFEFGLSLWRRRALRGFVAAGALAAACTAGGLLGAAQLLPTLDLGGYCSRPQMSFEFCSMYSLGPESLLTLVSPRFFGGPGTGMPYWGRWNPWEMTTYAGVVPLGLAVLCLVRAASATRLVAWALRKRARGRRYGAPAVNGEADAHAAVAHARASRVLFHALTVLVAGALALGEHTPLLRFVYDHVPVLRMFRAWCRCAFFMQFSLCVLAGLGADRLLHADNSPRGRADRAVLMGLMAAVLVAVWGFVLYLLADGAGVPARWMGLLAWRRGLAAMPNDAPADLMERLMPLRHAAVRALSLTLLFAAAALAVLPRWPRLMARPRLAQWALLLLVVPDVWLYALTRLEFVPAERGHFAPEIVAAVRADASAGRLLKGPVGQPANQAMADGLDEVTGYTGVLTQRSNDFLTAAIGISRDAQASWPPVDRVTPGLLKPNVAFQLLPSHQYVSGSATTLVRSGDQVLYRLADVTPRAYFAKEITLCATTDQALGEARWGRWQSRDIVETTRREILDGVAHVSDYGHTSDSNTYGGRRGHDGSGGYDPRYGYDGRPDESDGSDPYGSGRSSRYGDSQYGNHEPLFEETPDLPNPTPTPAPTPPPTPPPTPTPLPGDEGLVHILRSEPSRVLVAVQTGAPRLLVLADSYDPHWHCTMGGVELLTGAAPRAPRATLEILPVNIGFRGVVVPPGRHVLEFVYAPRSFRIGAAVSLLTAVVLAGAGIVGRRWSRAAIRALRATGRARGDA